MGLKCVFGHKWIQTKTEGLLKCEKCGGFKLSADGNREFDKNDNYEITNLMQGLLPMYRRLERDGTSEGPGEFNAITSACNAIVRLYGTEGLVKAIKWMKVMNPFGARRMAKSWEFILTGTSEESHLFDKWL